MASQAAPFRALPRAALGSGTRLSSSPSRCLPSVWCPPQGPERGHRGGQPQRGAWVMLAVPAERRADVVVLDADPLQPLLSGQARVRAAAGLHQGQERRGVGAAGPLRLRHRRQALGRVLADRLQHRVTHQPRARHLPQQALVDQLRHAVEHRQADVHRGVAYHLDDLQAGAPGEHRARGEEPPGSLGQQRVAPGDRGAQRLLPVRQVAAAAGQQAQRMVQPGQDRLRRQ